MVKVFSPMMSLDASGTIGKSITFSKWKGRNYVRKRVKPANPKSGLQVGIRAGVRFMSQGYATLTTAQKNNWKNLYKSLKITGLNSQIRFNEPRIRQNLGIFSDPTNVPAAAEAAPTAVVATAMPKSVKLTWVDSVGAGDYGTVIYQSVTGGFTADVSNLIRMVKKGTQVFVVTKLLTGTNYKFRVGGFANEGTLGTLAAEVNATPT